METVQRFSNRVDYFLRYRPRYPAALVAHLAREAGLAPAHTVADVGSGTGFLCEPFLRFGNVVYGVEPNAEMRAAAESLLAAFTNFRSWDGKAEATGLPDAVLDWVVAGQAFHWFDGERAAAEFRRILRPGGQAGIVWNERDGTGSEFMRAYDALLREHAPDYQKVGHGRIGAVDYDRLFGAGRYRLATFPNLQRLEREALRGRLISSSYAPPPGDPGHAPMLAALDDLFDRHAIDGRVAFPYVCKVYWGRLA